jgi:mono/diheme cytochrome c family protein
MLPRIMGVAALIGFVLFVWWADARSHAQQGFDWRKAQREYFAREGRDERPHVMKRAILADDSGSLVFEQCETCHVGTEKTHPGALLNAHPKSVGCTHCHGGTPGELSTAAHAKADLRGVSCLRCHGLRVDAKKPGDAESALRQADADKAMLAVRTGERIYRTRACAECHEERLPGQAHVRGSTRPPMPLGDLDVRRRPEQVLSWLLYPSRMDPRGAMPRFFEGRREDALAVTAYLFSQAMKKDTTLREDAEHGANVTGASAEEGARLYAALACASCHAAPASAPAAAQAAAAVPEPLGPSLTDIGRKSGEDYLATYLRDPARVHPHTRMPSFRLDAREAASLAKHLGTMKQKEPLPLAEDEARALAARDLGSASVTCSMGPATSRAECGKRLYEASGCAACHDATAAAPVGTPLLGAFPLVQTFHGKGARLDYALADTERAAVVAFMQARLLPPAPLATRPHADWRDGSDWGEGLVSDLGCRACHGSAEKEAPIASLLTGKEKRRLPPLLDGEGQRSRPEWLFAFLRRPGALGVRPAFHPEWVYGKLPPLEALAPRMPTYAMTEDETTALVRYMTRAAHPYPFTDVRPAERTPEERLSAFVLLNRGDEKTRCTSCHATAELPVDRMKDDPASVAPGLGSLSLRRRSAWVQSFIPTHDASHWAGRDKPAHPWTEKEAALVTDVLFSLDERARLPRAGEETRVPLP